MSSQLKKKIAVDEERAKCFTNTITLYFRLTTKNEKINQSFLKVICACLSWNIVVVIRT